jgi:phosphopantetheinyl transferase (holo-ACP synthase)
VLNEREKNEYNKKLDIKTKSQYLASRWALKEALVKATGNTSLFYPGIYLDKSE